MAATERHAAQEAAAAQQRPQRWRPNWLESSDPEATSEWAEGWDAPTWQQSPALQRDVATLVSGVLGLPAARGELQAQPAISALSALAGGQRRQQRRQGGGEAGLAATVWTAAHERRLARRATAAAARRERTQAFWVSLMAAAGVGALRWVWQRKGGQRSSSRRSTQLAYGGE